MLLFDALDAEKQHFIELAAIYTTSFRDPIFGGYRKVWIDHILYSNNGSAGWVSGGKAFRDFSGAQPGDTEKIWSKYPHASDHQPVFAIFDSERL